MVLDPVLTSPLSIGALGLVFGAGLAYASRKFAVEVDPRVEKLLEILPGANCGGCGYPGCAGFAQALAKGEASPTACAPGGPELAKEAADILGIKVETRQRMIAKLHCAGDCEHVGNRFEYIGLTDCAAAALIQGGPKACTYGCLGLGSCVEACPFGAIYMNDKGLPVVIAEKCTGCGNCVEACPKDLYTLVPADKRVHVLCMNHDRGPAVKKICSVGCIGCMMCTKVCPVGSDKSEKAITVTNFLASIDYEKCISCGLCAQKCPTGTIVDEVERGIAEIDEDKCIGCTACARACPVGAISGERKEPHKVDPDKCIGCEVCVSKCPPKARAIRIVPKEDKKKDSQAA
jgi:electron transport complex protein RnfB